MCGQTKLNKLSQCRWAGGGLLLLALLLFGVRPAYAQTSAPALPTVVKRIPFAAFPQDFLLDRVNNRLYISDQNGTLTVLAATDYQVLATLPTVPQAQLTLAPTGRQLYLTPSYRRFDQPGLIQILDTTTLTVSAIITNATAVALDPTHNRLFVGNALLRPTPPNAPVAGLRVLDATTLATIAAAPLDGIPVYNPPRDELLLAAGSLYRVDPATLTVQEDLFPEISAQACPDCIGASEIVNVQVLAEVGLLAFEHNVRSTPTGGRVLPMMRFLDAATLAAVTPQPVVQPTCNRRALIQPTLAGRIYRHQAYASTFLFHNWRIETPTGKHLRTIDGLEAPFLNPKTKQAYAGGWVLALPAVEPVGRLPALTCIWEYDQERGLIYAQFQNELVVLAEKGGTNEVAAVAVNPLDQLPVQAVTKITPAPNFSESQTLFVTQSNTLYRSTDGGAHWLPLNNLPLNGLMPLQVAISPNFAQDQTLFVSGGNEMGQGDQLAGGVFRSTDGGDHWQPRWNGLDHLRVSAVAVSPHYTADQTVLAYAHVTDVATGFTGAAIQRSTDGGLHWSVWLTMTPGLLPPPAALLPGATPPPLLPVRLNPYNDQLIRPTLQTSTALTVTGWEGLDLGTTLGSTARVLVAAPDLATSGVVYLMGDSTLWRVQNAGATIQAWADPRLVGRTAYTEVLTSLAVTAPDRDGAYRLLIGTGGGEVWVLDPATVAWTDPLTVTAVALTPTQAGIVTQPRLSYLQTQTTSAPELVLRNSDGTGRRAVPLPATVTNAPSTSIAPDGRWLVYYTGEVSRPTAAGSDDLTLQLLEIATGKVLTVATLLPPDFPANLATNARLIAARYPDVAADPQLMEGIWWAFADALTIHAWSPDGRTLAFAGAMDGPSSDLYLYDTVDGALTRLTDGPEQLTAIRWSPDGEWIWHNSVSIGYCQGCYGHKYAAARDGSTIITIPGDESDRFLGWLGPTTYLESPGANGIGYFDLRTVDLTGQPGRTLWPGVYDAFVLDWPHQQLIVDGAAVALARVLPGAHALYAIDLQSGISATTTITNPLVAPFRAALQRGPKEPLPRCPIADTRAGATLLVYPCNDSPVSPGSPDGRWHVTQDLTLQTVDRRTVLPSAVAQTSQTMLWRPDSAGFYFLVEGDLYYRPLLDSWPVLIEQGVSQPAWVGMR